MATRVVRERIVVGVSMVLLGCTVPDVAEQRQVYFDPSYAPPAPPGQAEPVQQSAEPAPDEELHVDIEPAGPVAIVQAPPRKPTQASRSFDPKLVIGLDRGQTVGLLGEPNNVREEPPATVWSYRVEDCSLDVFFYLDLASQHYRVLNYEVTAEEQQDSKRAIQRCLGKLRTVFRERSS